MMQGGNRKNIIARQERCFPGSKKHRENKKKFILRLAIIILSLKIIIRRLKIYIASLKINFSCLRKNFFNRRKMF